MTQRPRTLALAVLATVLALPSLARADMEPLFKEAKLPYTKSGDHFEVNIGITPSQSRRVIVLESELGTTGVKYARVVVIAATFPKGKLPAAVTKMQTTKWDKLALGRVRVLEEDLLLVVYENDFFLEGAVAAQLRLNVEVAAIFGGVVEKDVSAAKGEE